MQQIKCPLQLLNTITLALSSFGYCVTFEHFNELLKVLSRIVEYNNELSETEDT